jgi:hypothetical protein
MKSAKVLPTCYDAAAEEDRKVDGTSIYQSEKASLKPIFLAVEDLHGDFSVDKLLELTKLHQFQLHFQGLLGVMKVISNSIYISTFFNIPSCCGRKSLQTLNVYSPIIGHIVK